jgi:hypothetical protein
MASPDGLPARLPDRSFDAAVKSIVERDFFPALAPAERDSSLDRYTLDSFLAACESSAVADFVRSVECDRQRLRDSRPGLPAPASALFRDPDPVARTALAFDTAQSRRIAHEQTRFGPPGPRDFPFYRPSVADASTSETESEFEGRSQFRRALLAGANFSQIRKERFFRKKRTIGLSDRGKALFDALDQGQT